MSVEQLNTPVWGIIIAPIGVFLHALTFSSEGVSHTTPTVRSKCHNPGTATTHGCPTSVHGPFQDL